MIEKILTPEIIIEVESLALIAFAMAFNNRIRDWWMRVSNNKCQYEFYNEKRGWQECNRKAEHIHHIKPEGFTRAQGEDPDHNVGMGLCKKHHVKNLGEEEHSENFSFHTDIAKAYDQYPEWKRQHEHMQVISGQKLSYDGSPFNDVSREHKEKIMKGERYWNGSQEIDNYYIQKMRDKATRYIAEHSNDPKPIKKEDM